jgi:DNA-directed RNA polymerase subunit alpha
VLIVQRPRIEEVAASEFRSRFLVEPLEPGFGYTLGNTMRRTLLSRIPGAAVTHIQIEGVQHEFSTVPGVVEDVVDLILNVKHIVVKLDSIDEQTLYLSAKGAGVVTAGHLKVPAGVTTPISTSPRCRRTAASSWSSPLPQALATAARIPTSGPGRSA